MFVVFSAISPASLYYSESLNTLLYAQRAKCIKNNPVVNEVSAHDSRRFLCSHNL